VTPIFLLRRPTSTTGIVQPARIAAGLLDRPRQAGSGREQENPPWDHAAIQGRAIRARA